MSTATFRVFHRLPNSTPHVLVFDRSQGYVLSYGAQTSPAPSLLPPGCVWWRSHSLFFQSVFVSQRSCSLLLFSHRETHCYHHVITPQLKGDRSRSTVSPQSPGLRTVSCNNLWLGIKRAKCAEEENFLTALSRGVRERER